MVGVSYTVDTHMRSAEEVAQHLISPEQTRALREAAKRAGHPVPSPPKAQNVRRLASLERSKPFVVVVIMQDATVRDPELTRPWVIVMVGALGLWAVLVLRSVNIYPIKLLDNKLDSAAR